MLYSVVLCGKGLTRTENDGGKMTSGLSGTEIGLLLKIIQQCYEDIVSVEKLDHIVDQLKDIIPFDYWGLVYCFFDSDKLHVKELSWFRGIPGFEEAYINGKLFLIDPISLTAIEMAQTGNIEVQFWAETYAKFPESEFYEHIFKYEIANYNGYTGIYLPDLAKGIGFSITGPGIMPNKDPKIVEVINIMLPHIYHIAFDGKVGDMSELTDQQLRVCRMSKAGLTNEQIAAVMKISKSGVEKHLKSIMKKTGVNNKKELAFGYRLNFGDDGN